MHTPLVRQFNLTFQYEVVPTWVLEAGYVGASGINLVDTYHDANAAQLASPSNPINGQTTNTAANVQLRVPYLGYQPTGYQITAFDGIYNYNSLQVTLRKRFSHGLTLQASYTWSKDLTTLTESNFNNISADSNDPSNLAQQYGPAYFSHPNRFVISYSYDLPFGHHTGGLGLLANGWNVSGVTTIQDGVPLTIADTALGTAYGTGGFAIIRAQMCPGQTYGDIPPRAASTSVSAAATAARVGSTQARSAPAQLLPIPRTAQHCSATPVRASSLDHPSSTLIFPYSKTSG